MSTTLPCRTMRMCALPRKYGLQTPHRPAPRCSMSASASRAFSTTQTQSSYRRNGGKSSVLTRAGMKGSVAPAPRVNTETAQRDVGSLNEDIGLIQDTIIRAPFGKLPPVYSLSLWGYFWKLVKAKATGLFSRSHYNRMLGNRGLWSYLPVDRLKHQQLKSYAKNHYVQIHEAFTNGDMATIRRFCLPPLARDLERRLASRDARGMKWYFDDSSWSARVVSHRAVALGEDQPNSAYRQVVVRLKSMQRLITTQKNISSKRNDPPRWTSARTQRSPKSATEGQHEPSAFVESDKPKVVVDYIVLQKMLVKGKEQEKWMVQGFADATSPEILASDELYWKKTGDAQASTAS